MRISNEHNLVDKRRTGNKRFGIRVRLNGSDPFQKLVDADWETQHWFATELERETALEDMAGRHRYSRLGDLPTLCFERIER